MKNFKFLFGALFAATLTLSSCGTGGCDDDFVCENNGTPFEDALGNCDCDCPDGFSGDLCQVDDCAAITCENGGEKVPTADGCECNCPDGYSGADCSVEIRAAILGSYNVSEECDFDPGNPFTYASEITAGATAVDITVTPLFPDGSRQPAVPFTMENESTMKLVPGVVDSFNFKSGSGLIKANGDITIQYLVNDGADASCVAEFTKQ